MLKSHFKIHYDENEEEPEQTLEEEAPKKKKPPKVVREVVPVRLLTSQEVGVNSSMLGKTVEGDGYTFLKCKINGLKLTNINVIRSFRNLLFVDVSQNSLELEALQVLAELPYLITIHADDNKLTSAALKRMKYLQIIIMNNNKIESVHDVYQPELSTLELGGNRIEAIAFDNQMKNLKVIDFRNNMITSVSNMDFPLLDSLYLAGNNLTTLAGLEKLVNLRILHVRNNPIRLLDGFDPGMTKLRYINLRNCKVSTLKQIKKLRVLTALDTLVLRGCPFMGGSGDEETEEKDAEDDPQVRIDILAALQRLKRLNKMEVTEEESQESKTLLMQWIEEGEVDEEEIEPEAQKEEEEDQP